MRGRFIWFDLLTTEVKAARAFYEKVVGWAAASWGEGFEVFSAGSTPVASVASSNGLPAHWLSYVEVEDVDAVCAHAQRLGAQLRSAPEDVPKIGRMATLVDPQGAVFAVYRPAEPVISAPPGAVGHFSWVELNTTDWKSAWRFYSALFGWKKTGAIDMGPELGEYLLFGADAQLPLGGMSDGARPMRAPAHWLPYASVKDLEAALRTVAELRGRVLNGPMEVPGGDRVAQCVDAQGAFFALSGRPPA